MPEPQGSSRIERIVANVIVVVWLVAYGLSLALAVHATRASAEVAPASPAR